MIISGPSKTTARPSKAIDGISASGLDYSRHRKTIHEDKTVGRLAGVMMLMGPLLLVARATADDGETYVNASDGVTIAACTRAIRSGLYNGHGLARPRIRSTK
jgi:hypothetical protein